MKFNRQKTQSAALTSKNNFVHFEIVIFTLNRMLTIDF